MQISAPDLHTSVEVVTAIFVLGGFIITLMIKNSQSTQAERFTAQINSHKEVLTAAISKTAADLAVHEVRDEEKFKAIEGKLDRIVDDIGKIAITRQ